MLPACRGAFQSERGALYAAMEALRDDYDLVVTHAPTDTNQDHRQVAEEAARVFKAHATLLGGEFPNNDLGGFTPQRLRRPVGARGRGQGADGQRTTARRTSAAGRTSTASVVRALARLRGSQIREPAAEAFAVVGRVVVRAAG